MAFTNHERVGKALELLLKGMQPYVEQEFKSVYGDKWLETAQSCLRVNRESTQPQGDVLRWDTHVLLLIMSDQWHNVFRTKLGLLERSLVSELREYRNRWAHQGEFDESDTYRVLDSAQRLLAAVSAEEAQEIGRLKDDVLRSRFQDMLDADAKQTEALSKKNWWILGYTICCAAVILQAYFVFRERSLIFSGGILLLFAYLVYQRLMTTVPQQTIHECKRCGRIIYREPCPYCQGS